MDDEVVHLNEEIEQLKVEIQRLKCELRSAFTEEGVKALLLAKTQMEAKELTVRIRGGDFDTETLEKALAAKAKVDALDRHGHDTRQPIHRRGREQVSLRLYRRKHSPYHGCADHRRRARRRAHRRDSSHASANEATARPRRRTAAAPNDGAGVQSLPRVSPASRAPWPQTPCYARQAAPHRSLSSPIRSSTPLRREWNGVLVSDAPPAPPAPVPPVPQASPAEAGMEAEAGPPAQAEGQTAEAGMEAEAGPPAEAAAGQPARAGQLVEAGQAAIS